MIGVLGIGNAQSELVQLCAVDFLTGEVLIDKYVVPTCEVVDWRTRYSDVTESLLEQKKAEGQTLNGWREEELWMYVDEDTILVGHALNNDLEALRMVHTRVVDSAILTKKAVSCYCYRTWKLKALCQELLGKEIQNDAAARHDCLEDTFAARDVVLFCIQYPDKLEAWAS